MEQIAEDTKNLELRGCHWHYNCRIPTRFLPFETRRRIRVSLKTKSLDTARARREALRLVRRHQLRLIGPQGRHAPIGFRPRGLDMAFQGDLIEIGDAPMRTAQG
ncbi:MAG: DUF6538 domain-containing protein [Maricaulaceae bacterium]